MKRLLMTLGLLAALAIPIVAITNQAAAVDIFPNCGSGVSSTTHVCQDVTNQSANNGSNNPIIRIIKAATEVISFVVGAAAVIGVVVSGLRLIIANGDANALASARSGLAYSLIGVAVVALAQAIVVFVLDKIH